MTTATLDDLELSTCSYPEMRPEFGVPVRTSNGYPRYRLKYELTEKMPALYPPRPIMNLPLAQFTVAYRDHLDRRTADITHDLVVIRRRNPGPMPLVLLCFEQLWKPGSDDCHRTVFAQWWTDRTGQIVPELGRTPSESRPQQQLATDPESVS